MTNKSRNPELLPFPFCGAEVVEQGKTKTSCHGCANDGMQGNNYAPCLNCARLSKEYLYEKGN